MMDRTVKLVDPLQRGGRWPLGYSDRGQATFEFRLRTSGDVLVGIIDRHMPESLTPDWPVRLRPDVRVEGVDDEVRLISAWLRITTRNQADAAGLAGLLAAGSLSVEQFAVRRERQAGVPLVETVLLLENLFRQGLFDEEPSAPARPFQ